MTKTITKVKKDVAEAITNLQVLLRRDFGSDYSFSICGKGSTIAKSNVTGVQEPKTED